MRSVFLIIAACSLLGCRTTPDPAPDSIERLVSTLSTPQPDGLSARPWDDGMFRVIDLPCNASIEEVIAKALLGQTDKYRILEMRQVSIRSTSPVLTNTAFTAVLVKARVLGESIVLLRYKGERIGWWNRIYPAKPRA